MNRIIRCDFSNKEYKRYIDKTTNKYTDKDWVNTRKARKYWLDLKYFYIL